MLFVSTQTEAECAVRSASILVNERAVSLVTDLVKTTSPGRCLVQFRLNVDGVWNNIREEEQGKESEEVLCNYAIEKGRNSLLASLGGKFQTEAITICGDGNSFTGKIKTGDVILENEVGRSKVDLYFNYNNARCRLFTERLSQNRRLVVNHGVICQTDQVGANWIVVDKW